MHAYGGVCYNGTIGLYMVSGTTGMQSTFRLQGYKGKGVNGGEYGNLLAKAIIPDTKKLMGEPRDWVFMQDGASAHRTVANSKLFREAGVELL